MEHRDTSTEWRVGQEVVSVHASCKCGWSAGWLPQSRAGFSFVEHVTAMAYAVDMGAAAMAVCRDALREYANRFQGESPDPVTMECMAAYHQLCKRVGYPLDVLNEVLPGRKG